jgi:uncharacterized phage protein (TIGR01671 family)
MQRKIEFRAWDKLNKIMTYDVLNKQPILEMVNVGTPQQDSIIVGLEEYSDLELTQFTGLKDQNGEEIFEGDILKIYYQNNQKSYLKEVKWLNDAINKGRWDALDNCAFTSCEVVGNIFENPELLEG